MTEGRRAYELGMQATFAPLHAIAAILAAGRRGDSLRALRGLAVVLHAGATLYHAERFLIAWRRGVLPPGV